MANSFRALRVTEVWHLRSSRTHVAGDLDPDSILSVIAEGGPTVARPIRKCCGGGTNASL